MDTETRERIVEEAMTWKGTPYHHKARIKGVGVDCGGLIYEVFKATIGLPHESFPDNYAPDWGLHKDDNELYLDFLEPYVKRKWTPDKADIIMFKVGRSFAHGTLYIGHNQIIHAYGQTGYGKVQVQSVPSFTQERRKQREYMIYGLDDKWL